MLRWLHRVEMFSSRFVNPLLSAIGAIFGIAGMAVLGYAPTQVATVFMLFLVSNVGWITVALRTRQQWLLLMNLTYMGLGLAGLARLSS